MIYKNHYLLPGLFLLFALTITSCITMEELAESSRERMAEGNGGYIFYKNTDNTSAYWVVHPNLHGEYRSRIPNKSTSGSVKRFSVHNEGSYTIYFRKVRDEDTSALRVGEGPGEDNFRLWNSKTVYVSNLESVTIEIP